MLNEVVFSERSMIALLSEILEHITTETGMILLGHRNEEIWYVVEAIDPGLNCVLQTDYFENDDVYQNHLMNKINRLYKKPLEIVGIVHRHPGSFDHFSSTDDGTNIKYARKHKDGAVSALVNIDPTFRLTMYHVTDPLSYRRVEFKVGDKYFPPDFLAYATSKMYLDQINHYDGRKNGLRSKVKKVGGFLNRRYIDELLNEQDLSRKLSFSSILRGYLRREKTKELCGIKYMAPNQLSDADLDRVLERIQPDLNYFEETGIGVILSILSTGGLEIKDSCVATETTPIAIPVFTHNGKIYFNYNEKSYEYYPGMFKETGELNTLLGGVME